VLRATSAACDQLQKEGLWAQFAVAPEEEAQVNTSSFNDLVEAAKLDESFNRTYSSIT